MKERISFADIPDAFKNVDIRSFKDNVYSDAKSRESVGKIQKATNFWLKNLNDMKANGMGLYISSNTKGSGKTRFVIGLANELIRRYDTVVKFSTSMQILDEIRATWDDSTDLTEYGLISELSETEVLIIDDFGTERTDKAWINDRFYSIINNRYMSKLITIFTSNYSLGEIEYDERIVSRIKERVYELPFPEESVREKIANTNLVKLWTEAIEKEG